MRAETQALVTAIQESLALLRRRLDWDTAEARMEEFDARAEDPELWNDPDNAQKVMRERQKLSDSMDAYRAIETEMTDQTEMIELGEMEEDAEVIAEAEAALVRDAVGNVLQDGDTVTVIKDLKLKSGAGKVKAGTKVRNIRLVDGDHDIDCRIEGFGQMGLKSEFVRKLS